METTTAKTIEIGAKVFRFAGVTDDVTECGCCGRQNLKRTVVLQPTDGGDAVFYGTTCAAIASGWRERDVKKAADEQAGEFYAAKRRAWDDAYYSHPDVVAHRAAAPAKWDDYDPAFRAYLKESRRLSARVSHEINLRLGARP